MRLLAVFAAFLAVTPSSAQSQNAAYQQVLSADPARACIKQMHLSFHAVSASARYGLIFDPGMSGGAAMLASWTAAGKLHRTSLNPADGGIVALGAGFPMGEQVVALSVADCRAERSLPRLIRLDRTSPDHGHRHVCLHLDPDGGRPILCPSAARVPSLNRGE